MADLLRTFSSLLGKLKPLPEALAPTAETPQKSVNTPPATPTVTEEQLRSFDDPQLSAFITAQNERAVIRILSAISDASLQLRAVQCIRDEATLKRVSRSQLGKKTKRAAEKLLREADTSTQEQLKLQRLAPHCEKMRAFIAVPRWPEAEELLATAFDLETGEAPGQDSHPLLKEFWQLRDRMKQQIETYERDRDELEEICGALDPRLPSPHPPGKNRALQLQTRWLALSDKYSLHEDDALSRRYHEILAARKTHRPAPVPAAPPQTALDPAAPEPAELKISADPETEALNEKKALEREEQRVRKQRQEESDRQHRLATLEKLMRRAQGIAGRLAQREAGSILRELQNEARALHRWRREFPEKLDALEATVKTLSGKRTEAVDEAKWDAWARTDRALRIQSELELLIGSLEIEQDAEAALAHSSGLSDKLQQFANEMKDLGSLERQKDSEIWKKFKALNDRGWVVRDRLRQLLFEKIKAAFSEHASKPLEFSVAALAGARELPAFKATAFAGETPALLRELRRRWIGIGAKSSSANREQDEIVTRLFEGYSRQQNLKVGQKLRAEGAVVEKSKELLRELKLSCESKATLLSRARVAKGLEQKWKNAALPVSISEELQKEFEACLTLLDSQLTAEARLSMERVLSLETRLKELMTGIVASSGPAPDRALKILSGLETELQETMKQAALLKSLRPEIRDAGDAAEPDFDELCARITSLIQHCRADATRETQQREQERDQALREAETLVLSTEWEITRVRFEELSLLWKKVGALGQKQDAPFGRLFEHFHATFQTRLKSRERTLDAAQREKLLKTRSNLLFALEALMRLRKPEAHSVPAATLAPLPFTEQQLRAIGASRLLEFGLKYGKAMSMDPAGGIAKETLLLMEQWRQLGVLDDGEQVAYWNAYVGRVRVLLGLT